jgi:hypothetical protein
MKTLTRDELKRELHTLIYSQQVPIAQLTRESGMDGKTINMALKGDVTEVTLRRFTAWLQSRADGRQIKSYRDNNIPKPISEAREKMIRDISWLAVRLKERGMKVWYRPVVNKMDVRKLNLTYYEYDERLKRELLKERKAKKPKTSLWLYDRWDARKWMEMIQHSEEDA